MLADKKHRTQIEPKAFTHDLCRSVAEQIAKVDKVDRKVIADFLGQLGVPLGGKDKALDAIHKCQGESARRERVMKAARDHFLPALISKGSGEDNGNIQKICESLHPDLVERLELGEFQPLAKPAPETGVSPGKPMV